MASVDIINELDKSRFLLLLLDEKGYTDKIAEIAGSMKSAERICYVCLSKPYKDVYEEIKKKGMDTKKFYFIDTLSAYYGKKKGTENCAFVSSPANLPEIKSAIAKAMKEKKCGAVIFDTISTMLIYQDTAKIVKFTHDFMSEGWERNKILYLVIKQESVPQEENERLVKDLGMFADKTLTIK